jgi:hypothetical protein
MVMKTEIVTNIPEDKTVEIAIVTEWDLDMMTVLIMDMEVEGANLQETDMDVVQTAIGELVATKVEEAIAVIQKINI